MNQNENANMNLLYNNMSQLYSEQTRIADRVVKLFEAIGELEENANISKTQVKKYYEEIKKYFDDLYIKIDNYKTEKKKIYLEQLNELKQKESQIKQVNDKLNQYMRDSTLNANEKQDKMFQLLQNPLISSIEWNDNLIIDNKILVGTDILPSIIQSMKENLILMESYELKLENPSVDMSKDPPVVTLKLIENIPNIWKDNCSFEIELSHIENLKEKEENKKNNDMKEMTKYNWEKIESNKIKKKEDGTWELKYKLNYMEYYALRMRANFFNDLFFTPFSNIQIFYARTVELELPQSSILSKSEVTMLLSYLPKKTASQTTLLYRKSRDGLSSKKFHELCDNKGPTVTIIKSGEEYVFGGFTNILWSSPSGNEYKNDPKAFIFLLRSPQSTTIPQKWNIKSGQEQYAVCHNERFGPIFGNQIRVGKICTHDIKIVNNDHHNHHFNFNRSYESADIGLNGFTVKEYEVYKVE